MTALGISVAVGRREVLKEVYYDVVIGLFMPVSFRTFAGSLSLVLGASPLAALTCMARLIGPVAVVEAGVLKSGATEAAEVGEVLKVTGGRSAVLVGGLSVAPPWCPSVDPVVVPVGPTGVARGAPADGRAHRPWVVQLGVSLPGLSIPEVWFYRPPSDRAKNFGVSPGLFSTKSYKTGASTGVTAGVAGRAVGGPAIPILL